MNRQDASSRSRSAFVPTLATAAALLFTVAGLLAAPTAAQAQSSDGEKAKKYYRKGIKAFHKDDYGMAITYLKRANSIKPSGTLLYNISLAYSKMGKTAEALEYARRAKKQGGMPKDTKAKNDARIAAYTVALKGEELTPKSSEPAEAEDTTGASSGTATNTTSAGGTGSTSPPGGGTDTHTLRWIGLSSGLAGLGLVGGGIAVGASVDGKISDKKTAEKNGDFETARKLHDEIGSQQTLGKILLFSGVGLAVGGTTLFIIDAVTSSSGGRAVNLIGGPNRNGFSVGVDVQF